MQTVTKVLTKQKYDDRGIYPNNDIELKSIDVYDQVLPKNDPKFLAPVRRWEKRVGFVTPIRWTNAIAIILFHVLITTLILYEMIFVNMPMWQTVFFELIIVGNLSGFGVTAGVHRYWTHRSFKARLPLKIIFMLAFSISGQNNIIQWVQDHRVHHKMSETTADPHNAHRGFFFSHVGWLMMKKHPHVIAEGKKIDMSDIHNDPVVQFHTKYFYVFKILCCFILPTVIKLMFWNETWTLSILSSLTRYMVSLNCTWSVNSFAHIWGNKPYDKYITPVENWKVSAFAFGEGWHNYHHTFPWDYKAAELAYFINVTTVYLDLFARIGWAYDLKKASPSLIQAVAKRKGDIKKE